MWCWLSSGFAVGGFCRGVCLYTFAAVCIVGCLRQSALVFRCSAMVCDRSVVYGQTSRAPEVA